MISSREPTQDQEHSALKRLPELDLDDALPVVSATLSYRRTETEVACFRLLFQRYFCLLILCFSGLTIRVEAQTILQRYRWHRTQEIARATFNQRGRRMPVRTVDFFETKMDSIRHWIVSLDESLAETAEREIERFEVESWQKVDAEQEIRFMALFDNTDWAFIGSTTRQRIDTTRTRDLRARMQALFGSPTKTLAELDPVELLTRDHMIEFEYWFVLNDSIPVIVIDTNGPWDRGVVMASAASYRLQLAEIKAAFLGQIIRNDLRSPFSDFYYNPEEEQWYITGFDGASFFDVRIGRPDMKQGRPDFAFRNKIRERPLN